MRKGSVRGSVRFSIVQRACLACFVGHKGLLSKRTQLCPQLSQRCIVLLQTRASGVKECLQ